MLRSRAVCLGAFWLGLMVHLDWHLGRPGHDALSFHLPWHWLLAVPAFLPIAWLVKRQWPDAALKAGLVVVLLGLLIGQVLEPLGESLLGAGTEPFTNPLRWRAFAEFVGAGLLTLFFAAPLIRRAGRAGPPAMPPRRTSLPTMRVYPRPAEPVSYAAGRSLRGAPPRPWAR